MNISSLRDWWLWLETLLEKQEFRRAQSSHGETRFFRQAQAGCPLGDPATLLGSVIESPIKRLASNLQNQDTTRAAPRLVGKPCLEN
jgi:hypothetical protein